MAMFTVTRKLTWRGAETVVLTAAYDVLGPSVPTSSRFDLRKHVA